VPLDAIAALVPDGGVVLDLGCGQGLLARRFAARVERVVAVDFDPRKCQMARDGLALVPNVEVLTEDIGRFLDRIAKNSAQCVVIADTLSSFISKEGQDALLACAASALAPDGVLLLKFIDTSPTWKRAVSHAISAVVYRGLRLSLSQDQQFLYRSRLDYKRVLEGLGFHVSEHLLHRTLHHPVPHVVLVARKPAPRASNPCNTAGVE
jgi:cyclopropane fatty-acyl-phospholipid synthase-like methyltransferase